VTPAIADQAVPALLQGQGLACRRGERRLFRALDFSLSPGEALLLRGPNGSGKSSLLRLVAGLLPAEAGSLLWRGRAVGELGGAYRAELGFLGHLDALKAQLSVRDNLRFWADLAESIADLDGILDQVGLGLCADLPAQFLSAGQRRRFSLARLLLRPAALWLLDEPTTALDGEGQRLVLGLIGAHLAAGGAALISSHDSLAIAGAGSLDLGQRR
jgi:heme exporter protein A